MSPLATSLGLLGSLELPPWIKSILCSSSSPYPLWSPPPCSHLAGPLPLPRSSPIPVLLLHEFNSSFYSPFSYLYFPSHCPCLIFIISLHIHFHSVIPNILFLRMNLLSLVQLPVSTSKSDRTACQCCLLHSRNKPLLTLLNHTW